MRKTLVYFVLCFFALFANLTIALYPIERLLVKTYICTTYTMKTADGMYFPNWMGSQQLISQKTLRQLTREECKN